MVVQGLESVGSHLNGNVCIERRGCIYCEWYGVNVLLRSVSLGGWNGL